MLHRLNQWIDVASEFFAARKGLLPIVGLALIVVNGLLQLLPFDTWLIRANLFLHLGLIVAIVGFMLAWAL